MSQKTKLLALMAAGMSFSSVGSITEEDLKHGKTIPPPKEPPIPKGCNVYYFTSNGEISDTPTDCKVIAINEKNALKKYNKKT